VSVPRKKLRIWPSQSLSGTSSSSSGTCGHSTVTGTALGTVVQAVNDSSVIGSKTYSFTLFLRSDSIYQRLQGLLPLACLHLFLGVCRHLGCPFRIPPGLNL
jgi:hypothetical protein